MSDKITGSDLEKLIKEAISETNKKNLRKKAATNPPAKNPPKNPFGGLSVFSLPTPKTGEFSRTSLKRVARIAFGLTSTDDPTESQYDMIKALAGQDNQSKDISADDLKKAYASPKYKPLINRIIGWLITNEDDKMTTDVLKTAGDDFEKRYRYGKTGINTDDKDVFVAPDDNRIPNWLNKSKNEKGLKKSDLVSIAKTEDPKDIITNLDFVEILQDPNSEYNFWVNDMVQNGIVQLDLGSMDDLDDGSKQVLLNILKKLEGIAKNYEVDPEDKGLGRDRPIPDVNIHSRYNVRTAGETPETLKRIFENTFDVSNPSLQKRLGSLSTFQKNMAKGEDELKDEPIEKTMSGVIALDYLRRIIQDYEASAGGFLFENFLAFMVSGTKEGGNAKIEDFSFEADGKTRLASAKLYKDGTTEFSGSNKLMWLAANRESLKVGGVVKIQYVLAMKGQDLEDVKIYQVYVFLKVKDDDPNTVEVYTGTSERFSKATMVNTIIKTTAGKTKYYDQEGETKMVLDWPGGSPIANINLIGPAIDKNKFNEAATVAMNSTKEKLGEMFKALNNFKVNSTKYFSIVQKDDELIRNDEKFKAMEATLESIKLLRQNAYRSLIVSAEDKGYKDLAKGKSSTSKIAKSTIKSIEAPKMDLEESKLTPDALKKIIEESFKR